MTAPADMSRVSTSRVSRCFVFVRAAAPDQPQALKEKGGDVMTSGEAGSTTGTKDKNYNIIWFTEQCLSNALRLESYRQDAERDGDSDLAEFFKRAQETSRKGADQGKELLRKRLAG